MNENCQICGNPAHGFHFGAFSCRACATFFKRAVLSKNVRKICKKSQECTDFRAEKSPKCKTCRLRKCVRMGMRWDYIRTQSIPKSFEKLVGRPDSVLFAVTSSKKKRNLIDAEDMVSQGYEILKHGAPTPLNQELSQLHKMSHGIPYSFGNCEKLKKVCKEKFLKLWNFDFCATAKWLTHLEEFSNLEISIQMKLLQSIWHVFARLYRTASTAALRKNDLENSIKMNLSDQYYVELGKAELDISWLSSYPVEQIEPFVFGGGSEFNCTSSTLIEQVSKLNLTSIELTYMTAQLCFQYAENRHAGTEIAEICEKFQKGLSDDLHNYYMDNPIKSRNYAGKLAMMLKVNQRLQKMIRMEREKALIARTFDIFTADFSHPEMFIDIGC